MTWMRGAIAEGTGRRFALMVSLVSCLGLANAGDSAEPLAPHQQLESALMDKLARIQADPATTLVTFTTDGCSGGMSGAWSTLSASWPAFAWHFGEQPPWQDCCVEHDRAYWLGAGGFAGRLAADVALRACVAETGTRLSEDLSEAWSQPPARIEAMFELAADLMYRAVRLGGGPCSPLPWRWGYGWPPCPLHTNAPSSAPESSSRQPQQ